MENFQVYRDIQARTGGDIYIGVVGPVRTGKSTFIRRFMEQTALPVIDSEKQGEIRDQLPLSGSGKLITTVEPKFIPKEAVPVTLGDDQKVKIRLIDCVGYLVKDASGHVEEGKERMVKTPWFSKAVPFHEAASIGTRKVIREHSTIGLVVDASGHVEEGKERMVKTPWFSKAVPFHEAASIGTRKVIREHSTIGLVVTTDGSFGEIPGENFREAEEITVNELKSQGKPFLVLINSQFPYKEETLGSFGEIPGENFREAEEITVNELKSQGKPFLVLINSQFPYKEETLQLAGKLQEKYGVSVMTANCEQLRKEDITRILEKILYEFPVSEIHYYIPKWTEMLPADHMTANCEQLRKEDITRILEKILYEFPVSEIHYYIPKWTEMLPADHELKAQIMEQIRNRMVHLAHIRDITKDSVKLEGPFVQDTLLEDVNLSDAGRSFCTGYTSGGCKSF